MESNEAAEILRGNIWPDNLAGRLDEALSLGAEALELLEWADACVSVLELKMALRDWEYSEKSFTDCLRAAQKVAKA